ncbi:hypothetical protein GCM10007860_06720 [Chitiniphilus shinanonensis]|uniref:Ice-binding protein C-terminal domain-containing protein n=1 Tax=Chitiniphilus shinanonensis TaxID=553088 RepID=A0ABQ6BUF1_9NEIS|nr:VPLPA-CTERM sorting domain-containing protein [Chitiniphilus shinanonensis]GLS03528.1 hypothetical protein GCM10007860_06720 [Chitiniphilus shinanonensis]
MSARLLAALGGLLCWNVASAQPATIDVGQALLNYDSSSFTFLTFDYQNPERYFEPAYTPVAGGISMAFDQFKLDHATSQPDDLGLGVVGFYEALFDFQAKPGYRIDGYTVSFSGRYQIENGGQVNLKLFEDPFFEDALPGAMQSFEYAIHLDGPSMPLLYGHLAAIARAGDVLNPGASSVLPGRAYLELDNIRLVALTSPVPEPASGLLLLGGAGVLAWHRRRQRRAA